MKRFIINSPAVRANAAKAVMAIMGSDGMEVIIQPSVDDQTAAQRGFFHVLIGILAKELGSSPNAMKIDIKRETFGSDTETVRGREVEVIRSSSKADKDEYSMLIETTYRIAAECGVILPAPRWKD